MNFNAAHILSCVTVVTLGSVTANMTVRQFHLSVNSLTLVLNFSICGVRSKLPPHIAFLSWFDVVTTVSAEHGSLVSSIIKDNNSSPVY